jgi:hypothetical protein
MLLYVVNYIDRVNVGFAALTMNKDLVFRRPFSASARDILSRLSHLPGAGQSDPGKIGAHRWMFIILAVWA